MRQFGLHREKEGVIRDGVEVVRVREGEITRGMKGENETRVKSMSEGSEGARPRWFGTYHKEQDQI